jgi:hypothetical protein
VDVAPADTVVIPQPWIDQAASTFAHGVTASCRQWSTQGKPMGHASSRNSVREASQPEADSTVPLTKLLRVCDPLVLPVVGHAMFQFGRSGYQADFLMPAQLVLVAISHSRNGRGIRNDDHRISLRSEGPDGIRHTVKPPTVLLALAGIPTSYRWAWLGLYEQARLSSLAAIARNLQTSQARSKAPVWWFGLVICSLSAVLAGQGDRLVSSERSQVCVIPS